MARIAALACLIFALIVPAAAAAAAGAGATKRVLARQMAPAGSGSGALVVDLDSGAQLYASRAGTRRMPASVQKLYTSATALRRLGAAARFGTDVLAAAGPDPAGVVRGDLYLRGGGDPYLSSLDLGRLADQLRAAGVARVTGRVVGDESAFDLLRGVPSSGFALTSETGPLSALAVNHGRTGLRAPYWQPSPARFAASTLAAALRRRGVRGAKAATAALTPPGAVALAAWRSLPLADLVRLQNVPSDNFMAETLLKGLGGGSTTAGAAAVRAELAELGIRPRVVDGSGLSRGDRTSPREVVRLLEAMEDEPAFTGSLAVAGRSGTLATRMRGSAAQDRCQAKTGTLRDVSALAGYCATTGGRRLAFAILMNRVVPWRARLRQDRMAAALARYSG